MPLVGGTIVKVDPPGKFGRPGRLTLQMTQVVEKPGWNLATDPMASSTRRTGGSAHGRSGDR